MRLPAKIARLRRGRIEPCEHVESLGAGVKPSEIAGGLAAKYLAERSNLLKSTRAPR